MPPWCSVYAMLTYFILQASYINALTAKDELNKDTFQF